MMRGLSHSMHHQDNVSYQPWLGMLPEMPPGSEDDMYGVHPHTTFQPQGLQHGYYEQSPTELVGGIQNNMPLMDPVSPYQDLNSRHRRSLPVRVMSVPQTGMMPPTNHNLDMSHNPYYQI